MGNKTISFLGLEAIHYLSSMLQFFKFFAMKVSAVFRPAMSQNIAYNYVFFCSVVMLQNFLRSGLLDDSKRIFCGDARRDYRNF